MSSAPWKISIDTGGTFTDCIGYTPDGELCRLKILSSSILRVQVVEVIHATSLRVVLPIMAERSFLQGFRCVVKGRSFRIEGFDCDNHILVIDSPAKVSPGDTLDITSDEEVPVFAARLLTQTPLDRPFPAIDLRLGSTRGTNALLERKGATVAFVTTKGFKDLLRIGYQQRPALFALDVRKEAPLYNIAVEIHGRISASGDELEPIDGEEVDELCQRLRRRKVEAVAIALLNSYKNPGHELLVQSIFRSHGFEFISCSHAISSQINLVPRAGTAVANAYLDPIINRYMGRIASGLKTDRFFVMSSAGGLLTANQFHPKDSLLSGPAGGVLGAYKKAADAGINKSVTFDMGGTSTDVSLCHHRPEYRYECFVSNQKILSPSIAIETIAAGGGSICTFDGYRLTVGPHSAGAYPGPACYGANGPLTLTDVNLLLGRIDEQRFSIPLRPDAAEAAFQKLFKELRANDKKLRTEEVLEAFIDIANEKMAEAIRKVSLQRGYAVGQYSLVTFGGAGGQHACTLASMLGIKEILIPYDAGLLSAVGIGNAPIEKVLERHILADLYDVLPTIEDEIKVLADTGSREWISEGFHNNDIELAHVFLFIRLAGQETSLEIEYAGQDVVKQFRKKYKSIYGHWLSHRKIEVESIRLILRIHQEKAVQATQRSKKYRPVPERQKNVCWSGRWMAASVFHWEALTPGAMIQGPALVTSDNSTVFVEPGWNFHLDNQQNARLRNLTPARKARVDMEWAQLELYSNRFTAIAHDMGTLMQRTSFSVNVKERMDFSCAVLDAKGRLIVNAPHIPVHLGSMGVCVREVIRKVNLQPGDVVLTNHPAFGGSHLPDLTLIKPVYHRGTIIAYVANRAHHAEIGGTKPGSMPADATRLCEEGVVIEPMFLLRKGKARWKDVEHILGSGEYPTRNIRENLADLNGALAALQEGESAIGRMVDEFGAGEVVAYMKKIYHHASMLMRKKISAMPQRRRVATEYLDDGARISVAVIKLEKKLVLDFKGSSTTHPGNLNATRAIVQSAVLYVLRLIIDEDVPLNEGLLSHVKLVLPKCFLNPAFTSPERSPAVAGGNTEVSQRLADVLIKVFELAACSQGTMNNFLFGNNRMGYYETIGGGAGAGNGFHGADAVHQHMTNTRITDPEMLEHRYPVRLEQFSVRERSGGKGKWRGGNGITRIIEFLDSMEVNILSQHRIVPPYGMKGGLPGKPGKQFVVKVSGKKVVLPGTAAFCAQAGDRVVIHTPGGGGWGLPS